MINFTEFDDFQDFIIEIGKCWFWGVNQGDGHRTLYLGFIWFTWKDKGAKS